MATLPTITVTDTQVQRLLNAYGSATAYKSWLREQIIAYVLATEASKRYADFAAADAATSNADRTNLEAAIT